MATQAENSALPSAEVVGNAFVEQYYLVLHRSPDNVHRFYEESSVLSRPDPDGKITTVKTVQGISEKLLSMDHINSIVEILTVDAQASYHNGFIVLVTGFLTREEYGKRKFVQTFFLAPQEVGYFVLNDILKFVDDDLSVEANRTPGIVESAVEIAMPVPSELMVDTIPSPTNDAGFVLCLPAANGNVNATEKEVATDVPVSLSIPEVPPVEPSISEVPPVKPSISEVPPVKPSITDIPPVAAEAPINDVKKNSQKKSYASIVHELKENTAPFNVKMSSAKPPIKSRAYAPAKAVEAAVPTANNVPEKSKDNADKGHFIFVGRLPMSATIDKLREAFERFGPIKPHGVQVRSNRPQGFCFGFIEFESSSSMEEALKAKDMMVGDSRVNIEEAKKNRGNNDRGNNDRGRFGAFRNDNFRGRRNFGGRNVRNEFGRRPEFSGRNEQNGEAHHNVETYQKVNQNGGRAVREVNA